MRKILLYIFLAVLLFSLIGCANRDAPAVDNDTQSVLDNESRIPDMEEYLSERGYYKAEAVANEFIASVIADETLDCPWDDTTKAEWGQIMYPYNSASEHNGFYFEIETNGIVKGYIQVLLLNGEWFVESYSLNGPPSPDGYFRSDSITSEYQVRYLGDGRYIYYDRKNATYPHTVASELYYDAATGEEYTTGQVREMWESYLLVHS